MQCLWFARVHAGHTEANSGSKGKGIEAPPAQIVYLDDNTCWQGTRDNNWVEKLPSRSTAIRLDYFPPGQQNV